MPENLWGELPLSTPIRTPTVILQEQANTLTELTKGVLVGRVQQSTAGPNFQSTLLIVAPSLNNYSYSVVSIQHPITLYPLTLIDHTVGLGVDQPDEEQFISSLGRILSSDAIKRVVAGLMAQIGVNAEQAEPRSS